MSLNELQEIISKKAFPLEWPGNFIANKWQACKGSTKTSSNNPNSGQKLIDISISKEVIQTALQASHQSQNRISSIPLQERIEILKRFRQTVADYENLVESVLRLEAGKPQWEAQEDIKNALTYIDWIVENHETFFQNLLSPATCGHNKADFKLIPLGTTIGYLPFSTPLSSFVNFFSATVLAGCPLTIFTSSHAILSSMVFGKIVESIHAPDNILNIVFGNYNSFRIALSDPEVAAVIYTGSVEHCDSIRKESGARKGRQHILQSGGKNAVIVHSSADMELAINCVTYGALKSAGQRCTSTSRVFVYRDLLDEFNKKLVETFSKIKIGRTDLDGDDQPFMGPLYSKKAVEKFLRFQTMANRESDKTLLWGKALENSDGGHFVRPGIHLLSNFDNNNAYQFNILFSPEVAIYPYEVLEDAIEKINTTDSAFAVSFVGEPSILEDRRGLFLAPNLMVNSPTVELETTLPLAGRLQSGHNRFHGPAICLYLCYPQALLDKNTSENSLSAWPWPKF